MRHGKMLGAALAALFGCALIDQQVPSAHRDAAEPHRCRRACMR